MWQLDMSSHILLKNDCTDTVLCFIYIPIIKKEWRQEMNWLASGSTMLKTLGSYENLRLGVGYLSFLYIPCQMLLHWEPFVKRIYKILYILRCTFKTQLLISQLLLFMLEHWSGSFINTLLISYLELIAIAALTHILTVFGDKVFRK